MSNSTTKIDIKPDSRYITVIWFEKGVRGHSTKSFDSFVFAYDFASELSKNPKFHGVHITRTEYFYFGGN